jgi:hypothetical protein
VPGFLFVKFNCAGINRSIFFQYFHAFDCCIVLNLWQLLGAAYTFVNIVSICFFFVEIVTTQKPN